MKVYEYKNCSTCQKAIKFLDQKVIRYERIPIVDKPPSLAELKQMLRFLKDDNGSIKSLFNSSGIQYRELKMSEKLKNGLSENDALRLLSNNGKLVKRPFVISKKFGLVGFKPDAWLKYFKA